MKTNMILPYFVISISHLKIRFEVPLASTVRRKFRAFNKPRLQANIVVGGDITEIEVLSWHSQRAVTANFHLLH